MTEFIDLEYNDPNHFLINVSHLNIHQRDLFIIFEECSNTDHHIRRK